VHSTLVNVLCTVIHSGPRGSSIDGMRTARSLVLLSLLLCLLLLLSVAPTGSQLNRPGYDLLTACQRTNQHGQFELLISSSLLQLLLMIPATNHSTSTTLQEACIHVHTSIHQNVCPASLPCGSTQC
jgi:hypothetical protein